MRKLKPFSLAAYDKYSDLELAYMQAGALNLWAIIAPERAGELAELCRERRYK